MKNIIIGGLIVLLFSSCNSNRYEIISSSSNYTTSYMLDKKTGQVWLLDYDNNNKPKWYDFGIIPKKNNKYVLPASKVR